MRAASGILGWGVDMRRVSSRPPAVPLVLARVEGVWTTEPSALNPDAPNADEMSRSLMRSARVLSVQVPGGRRLTGRTWDGEGAPLVLLHGLLDSSEGWDDM